MILYEVDIMFEFFVIFLKSDFWIFGRFTTIIPERLPKIET